MNKPLVFLGSNSNIHKIYELGISAGYEVIGIIDDDYHGQGKFKEFTVIATEQELVDNTDNIQEKYQYICVTNWLTDKDSVALRNKEKRIKQINLLDSLPVQIATVISPLARVSNYSNIGVGTFIDDFVVVEPHVTIADHVAIHSFAFVGHNSNVGRNSVLQRYCFLTSNVTLENTVYLGLCSKILRSDVIIRQGTFVHPGLMLLRGTAVNEEVSLAGKDLRKVYQSVEIS